MAQFMLSKSVIDNTYVYVGESAHSWMDIISQWDVAMSGWIIGLVNICLVIWGIKNIKRNAVKSGMAVERVRLILKVKTIMNQSYIKLLYILKDNENDAKVNHTVKQTSEYNIYVSTSDEITKFKLSNIINKNLYTVDSLLNYGGNINKNEVLNVCDIRIMLTNKSGIIMYPEYYPTPIDKPLVRNENSIKVRELFNDALFPFDTSIMQELAFNRHGVELTNENLHKIKEFIDNSNEWLRKYGEPVLQFRQ